MKPLRDVLLWHSGLIQRNQASSLSRTEPWIPEGLTGLANQSQYRSFSDAITATKISCRRAGSILSYHALDRLSLQPLTDTPFGTTVGARRSLVTWTTG